MRWPSNAGNWRRLLGPALLMTFAQAGCGESSRADVLQEFPPPRLAHETPSEQAQRQQLDVKAAALQLNLAAQHDEQAFDLSSEEGRFDFTPGQSAELRGELSIGLDGGDLPRALREKLAAHARGARFVWRVVEVQSVEESRTERDQEDHLARTELTALTEVEFNAVRTRHVQTLTLTMQRALEGEDLPLAGDTSTQLRWKRPLTLDLQAHRLHAISTLPSDGPLKRVEVSVQAVLTAASPR